MKPGIIGFLEMKTTPRGKVRRGSQLFWNWNFSIKKWFPEKV